MSSLSGGEVLVFLCLSLIYGITTFFSILRVLQINRFSSEWKLTKFFYIIVLAQSVLRTLIFLLFLFDIVNGRVAFIMVSMPDSLFITDYLMLVLQMFNVYTFTHSDPQIGFLASMRREKSAFCSRVVFLFLLIWVVLQSILYIAYVFTLVSSSLISDEIGTINMGLPSICIAMMIGLSIKFSGTPARSSIWKDKLRRINLVTLFWSVSRFLRGTIDIIDRFSDESISDKISKDMKDLLTIAIWILVLVVSEVICLFLVLDYGFVWIFMFSDEDNAEGMPDQTIEDITEEECKGEIYDSLMSVEQPVINESDIEIVKILHSGKKKLGILFLATVNGQEVLYRKIQFARMSKYVIQEFSLEIESFRKFTYRKLVGIRGALVNPPTLGMISTYFPLSLYQLLHEQELFMNLSEKITLCKEIGQCVQEIHTLGKPHGHITSHNIMLTADNHPLLADVGFAKLRKYAAIMNGYSTKSGWSSPEILADKRLVPIRTEESDDIYSFGMIIWEVFSKQEPFAGFSSKMLEEKVVSEGLRPKVPESIPESIVQLILTCWNAAGETRPTIDLLLTKLDQALRKI